MFIVVGKFEFCGLDVVLDYAETKQAAEQVIADVETTGGNMPESFGELKQTAIYEIK